jgi:hypothetical protein
MYPDFKKGLFVGLTAGFISAMLVFGLCILESTESPATEVLWRESNWMFAVAAFVSVGAVFGLLATFRPDMKRKR